ncbi:glycosyltransferase [Melioribacter sp. OK-6-Me]|uniref:glycosyltransferase n=1 Tax=unclassified Melioribacter TaxID=2627329 RepID=UPI003ED92E96
MFENQKFLNDLQSLYDSSRSDETVNFIISLLDNNNLSKENKSFLKFYLAREYFFRNELENAEKLFCELVDNSIKQFNCLFYLAEIFWKTNRQQEAILLLNKIYSVNPELKHLLKNISLKLREIEKQNKSFLLSSSKILLEEKKSLPLISIIILCYNKVDFTKKCLSALFENTNYENYEVIVLDNGSVDDTPDYLLSFGEAIKLIRSNTNLGFVKGNNYASQFALGDYIVFLNNDTEPQQGWLNHLLHTFDYHKDAGAAGSMLIYPDGKLQEAGGIIFNDASGWNYGRGNSPNDSKYSYCREVDYCSGAALMIRKDLFDQIGKFDERYSPAYYEDTDLCFSVRKIGYKVYYNPFSKVIHHEGTTAGTDLNSGFKKYQVVNSSKFIEKWRTELKKQYPSNPNLRFLFSDRNKGKRILIIDDIPPLPDRAAGALRHFHTLNEMINLGYKVTYVHLMGQQYTDYYALRYLTDFRMRGVEFIWFNYEYWYNIRYTEEGNNYIKSLIASLELRDRYYDFIYIAFWHIAEYFIDIIKSQVPNIPILIDTMDIHYLREERECALSNNAILMEKIKENKKRELLVYSKADVITTVTESDRAELRKYIKDKPIFILTDVHIIRENTPSYKDRKDLLFVGNFNHKPNEDAVLFFVKRIFPKIKLNLPDIKLFIVGNNPSENIKVLDSNDIIVTGWVPDVKEYIDRCRIEVVPLRYGAGNKGKVGEALANGLPIVTTSIGAEGMGIEHGLHAYVSDIPEKFAELVVELYNNKELWSKFSAKGKELIASQYSSSQMRKRIQFIFNHTKQSLKSTSALKFSSPPKVSIIIVAYNQIEYTKKCIQSIQKYVTENYEIVLIDNASNDGTMKQLFNNDGLLKYYRNEYNYGFPVAINQGILNSLGDYILVLNNDTVLTEGLVERMIEIAESDSCIGLVAPLSNEVSGLQKDNNAKYNSLEEMHEYARSLKEKNKGIILQFPRVAFLCTLIKREVIDKIGGLDERFTPGNFEDDDFCLRAQLAGFKTVIAKDVFIHHYGSKSFKANGIEAYKKRLEINRKKFVEKWGADPDEIWLQNKSIKSHQIYYPIDIDLCKQYFERTKVFLKDNELRLAEESIVKAIENYKEGNASIIDNDDLMNLAGNIFLANSNISDAQHYFEKELNLNPQSSSACFGLGQVFLMQNNLEAAKVMFEWAVKNDPNNTSAVDALANVNNLLGYELNHSTLEVS